MSLTDSKTPPILTCTIILYNIRGGRVGESCQLNYKLALTTYNFEFVMKELL